MVTGGPPWGPKKKSTPGKNFISGSPLSQHRQIWYDLELRNPNELSQAPTRQKKQIKPRPVENRFEIHTPISPWPLTATLWEHPLHRPNFEERCVTTETHKNGFSDRTWCSILLTSMKIRESRLASRFLRVIIVQFLLLWGQVRGTRHAKENFSWIDQKPWTHGSSRVDHLSFVALRKVGHRYEVSRVDLLVAPGSQFYIRRLMILWFVRIASSHTWTPVGSRGFKIL